MPEIKFTDVFVPGGFPRHTYNPRVNLNLEATVGQVLENLCKLVTITGHTKSGKTVLVRKILPREDAIWVDGGGVGAEEDFWTTVIDQLDIFQSTENGTSSEGASKILAGGVATANIIVAKGEGKIEASYEKSHGHSSSQSRTVSSRVTALKGLRSANRAIVIDDFHYLRKELQGDVVRALKPLIFDGLPVVIIAIPHRRYDAIKVEKEMTGRILPVSIPSWGQDELKFIPKTGFALLHGNISMPIATQLASESFGSPHLMQEFCRAICRTHGVSTSFDDKSADLNPERLSGVFSDTAETIGRPIFEKLARGPRQRSDRIPRKLRDGGEVDIYGLVLHALAHLRPGLVTLEYEDLRSAIKAVSDDVPQLHEVARVLKHMSEIAATDQSSTPVIDFDDDDKRLHVTDPFFAFYLRRGNLDA